MENLKKGKMTTEGLKHSHLACHFTYASLRITTTWVLFSEDYMVSFKMHLGWVERGTEPF